MGKLVIQIPFGPVVEPKIEGAFLSEHPYNSLKNGHVHDVPWMVGVVEQEASAAVIGWLIFIVFSTRITNGVGPTC